MTLDVMRRTEHLEAVDQDQEIIREEFRFIDAWLKAWAPEDVKFELRPEIDTSEFNEQQRQFLSQLAEKVVNAPEDADGEWFHKAVYDFKETSGLDGKQLFQTLYTALIGKTSGPRAGWFLSILPRDWLVARLRLEK